MWEVSGLLAATDLEIFRAARAAGATILTKDRDFPDLVQRHSSPPFIIWGKKKKKKKLTRILRGAIVTACELVESGESIVEINLAHYQYVPKNHPENPTPAMLIFNQEKQNSTTQFSKKNHYADRKN